MRPVRFRRLRLHGPGRYDVSAARERKAHIAPSGTGTSSRAALAPSVTVLRRVTDGFGHVMERVTDNRRVWWRST